MKTLREWIGLRCRTKRVLQNGYGRVRRGTIVVVESKGGGGLCVSTPLCETCGTTWFCCRVRPEDLDPIERVSDPEPPRKRKHTAKEGP